MFLATFASRSLHRAGTWRQLCKSVDEQTRLLDFVSVFEHLKKHEGWRCECVRAGLCDTK